MNERAWAVAHRRFAAGYVPTLGRRPPSAPEMAKQTGAMNGARSSKPVAGVVGPPEPHGDLGVTPEPRPRAAARTISSSAVVSWSARSERGHN